MNYLINLTAAAFLWPAFGVVLAAYGDGEVSRTAVGIVGCSCLEPLAGLLASKAGRL